MRANGVLILVSLSVLFLGPLSADAQQIKTLDGYTVMDAGIPTHLHVCAGTYDESITTHCKNGQIVPLDVHISNLTRISADRLEQIRITLVSIEQKMSENTQAVVNSQKTIEQTQKSIVQQMQQSKELLQDTIVSRFNALPAEILANKMVKDELENLKQEILKEVAKQYPKPLNQ